MKRTNKHYKNACQAWLHINDCTSLPTKDTFPKTSDGFLDSIKGKILNPALSTNCHSGNFRYSNPLFYLDKFPTLDSY